MKAEPPAPRPPPTPRASCQFVMVAVPKQDFKLVNDLAEASWIASDPENKQAIKELRRNLLRKVRPDLVLVQSSHLTSHIFSTTRK